MYEAKVSQTKFGTFSGVFLPSILAILGAVMYYIAPQIVGGVGIYKTILIILIAHSVTIATAFSISSIATNINVKGGGLYYLISRSLGLEFGGALGIQLYLAQTIAAAFYAIAFARGISSILIPFGLYVSEHIIALIALALFGLIVYIGARFVIKIQYAILAALLLSLMSIFLGPNIQGASFSLFIPSTIPFWVAFAMFFPAVTGIDAGVGMSGELKDPRKSLVIGTFTAIFVTMFIYLFLVIKFFMAATPDTLISDPFISQSIALVPSLVLLGIIMATSSSALSTLMTGPRSLTAMLKDKVLPEKFHFLKNTIGKSSEPRVAILFTVALGMAIILVGPLELVSQIVSMFFLSVYGWINGAAFFEKISQNPSYRPLFNTPTIISFYGMFAAYAIMYLFNPKIMVLGLSFQLFVFYSLYKSKKSMKVEGVWDGVFFQFLRMLLKRMEITEKSKKNWRPTILAFCSNDLNKDAIANLLHWIGAQRSVTKMYFLKEGTLKDNSNQRNVLENSMENYVRENKLEIFPRIILSDKFEETISSMIQGETLGNMPLNTVLVDYGDKVKLDIVISDTAKLKKNAIILRNQAGFSNFKRIDVWWSSSKNGNLMLLLAYIITHSKKWLEQRATIKIYKMVSGKDDIEKERQLIEDLISESRIENTEIEIICGKEQSIKNNIQKYSEHADLVLIGLPNFEKNVTDKQILKNIDDYTKKLKVSLVVMASDEIDFRVN
jgi:amino acid transporter